LCALASVVFLGCGLQVSLLEKRVAGLEGELAETSRLADMLTQQLNEAQQVGDAGRCTVGRPGWVFVGREPVWAEIFAKALQGHCERRCV
jgi:hypothetical protein